jgi:hypothetical protein
MTIKEKQAILVPQSPAFACNGFTGATGNDAQTNYNWHYRVSRHCVFFLNPEDVRTRPLDVLCAPAHGICITCKSHSTTNFRSIQIENINFPAFACAKARLNIDAIRFHGMK